MARSRNGRGVVIIGIGVGGVLALGALFWLRPWETPGEGSPAAAASSPATPTVASAATQPARQPMNVPNAGAVMRPVDKPKAKTPTMVPTNSKAWMDAALGGGPRAPVSPLLGGQAAPPIDIGSTPAFKAPDFTPPSDK